MQPIFTMQYGEFAVADFLSKRIKMFLYLSLLPHRKKELTYYSIVTTMDVINSIQFKSKCPEHITMISRIQATHVIYGLIASMFSRMRTGISWSVYTQDIQMMNSMQKQIAHLGTLSCLHLPTKKCRYSCQK